MFAGLFCLNTGSRSALRARRSAWHPHGEYDGGGFQKVAFILDIWTPARTFPK